MVDMSPGRCIGIVFNAYFGDVIDRREYELRGHVGRREVQSRRGCWFRTGVYLLFESWSVHQGSKQRG